MGNLLFFVLSMEVVLPPWAYQKVIYLGKINEKKGALNYISLQTSFQLALAILYPPRNSSAGLT